MQPLKRFTQCGSLTMLFAVFIVLFGVSSTALTTFGKSPNPPPPPATPAPAKARECATHNDCSSLKYTSCVKDDDDRLRCLCGDNKAPNNGQCSQNKKRLRHMCGNSDECDYDLICGTENVTRSTAWSRNNNVNELKICLCDEENGYKEDTVDNDCNGSATRIFVGVLLPVASLTFGFFISKMNFH